MHHLCGYVHGAAGIGHALAELFGATGEARFREAAERAFDYERSWLDPRTRNVAGSARRRAPRRPRRPSARRSDSWCNGALGIALSRLRAAELFASERSIATPTSRWRRANGTSASSSAARRTTSPSATGRRAPPTCCSARNGRGGPRGTARPPGDRAVRRTWRARFPCGVPLGDTPGLLLGFAGIGMFYLRLADPAVQSPLLIHRPQAVDSRGRARPRVGSTRQRRVP